MNYHQTRELLLELSEEERVEAFATALGMLTEDELKDMVERCGDLIAAVEKRVEKGGAHCIA